MWVFAHMPAGVCDHVCMHIECRATYIHLCEYLEMCIVCAHGCVPVKCWKVTPFLSSSLFQ